jgi:uncharacterized membrane protein
MSDTPVEVIVAAFQDEKAAKNALDSLKKAQKQGLIKIENAAVLSKDQKGKLHIKETEDMGGRRGAALGGVGGAAIGLIAGAALVVPVAVGALVGGLTAKLRDTGFSDKRLESLGESLKPGSSAIVAVVEHIWVDKVKAELAKERADVTTAAIKADIAEQLEAGHDVGYSVLAAQEGMAMTRVAGNKDEVDATKVIVDDTGVYGARFVATKEGFAAEESEAAKEAPKA